ncbi:MAG: hypothetical protein M5U33_03730 [Pseudorhodoplanes sp.]|nr:hypothetical protein [Pseudorhodoplanes sp.]
MRARDLPAPSARSDLSNVIPFVRRARRNAAAIPTLDGAQAARPAPPVPPVERRQTAALVALSLIAHGAVCAAFLREPEPHASIGLISVSAELVLGAQSHAGLSPKPSETETTSLPSPKPDKPQDRTPEAARRDLTVARTPDDAPTDRKPDARETPARKSEQPLSAERPPIPADDAELVATARPADSPSLDAVAPKPADSERKPAPARGDRAQSQEGRQGPPRTRGTGVLSLDRLQQRRARPLARRHQLSRPGRRPSRPLQAVPRRCPQPRPARQRHHLILPERLRQRERRAPRARFRRPQHRPGSPGHGAARLAVSLSARRTCYEFHRPRQFPSAVTFASIC